MTYNPITSFRRPVEAVQLARHRSSRAAMPESGVDKWQTLRALTAARAAYGLGDRALTVLQALLSFHPGSELKGDDLIVFPSNKAICERLNGMACSTMRRHLATLLDAGLVLRRDSPNGKRFVRRYRAGSEAFGFDLSPLLERQSEIRRASEEAIAAKEALERRRRHVSLMRRDLAALIEFGIRTAPEAADWADLSDRALLAARGLRRKLGAADLEALARDLCSALDSARSALDAATESLSTNTCETEQHHHKSNKEYFESDALLQEEGETGSEDSKSADDRPRKRQSATISLPYVLSVCREIQSFTADRIVTWADFSRAAEVMRPMLAIPDTAWHESVMLMGHESALVTVAAMLERVSEIRSPGAYLRHLARKASDGRFSPVTMLSGIAKAQDTARISGSA